MDGIGAEVGQKMRSAIKAKLLELNCYVDDELPDYVMVMVANKRTKSQMKEDLQLFLKNKTGNFVDWLHIVLKKLKEVTVTNPDVYKKVTKRKSEEITNIPLKKEKKDKKMEKKIKKELKIEKTNEDSIVRSLTDDLPMNVNKLADQRKIIVLNENKSSNSSDHVIHDDFDIPSLSAVGLSTEEELEDIEKKIKSVKSRLGIQVESEDDDEDCIRLKPEPDELLPPINKESENTEKKSSTPPRRAEHTRITFNSEDDNTTKRKSVLERLGKRQAHGTHPEKSKRGRIDLSDFQKNDEREERPKKESQRTKESVLNRLGVMSKVSVPEKKQEVPDVPFKNREVPSMVQVRPRIIPPNTPQANKNLLLKAVAEAQRSVAQTPSVGQNLKVDGLYTKKYKEKLNEREKESQVDKKANVLNQTNLEYIPTPISEISENMPRYIPTSKSVNEVEEENRTNQKFIVTLRGLIPEEGKKISIKDRLDKRRSPSPIIFKSGDSPNENKSEIPDKLPVVQGLSAVKNKERCKYWPSCRQSEKCEFVHPTTNCEKFPHCMFGEKCLFIHPICKFGASCTRRDCVYSHNAINKNTGQKPATPVVSPVCKFFPNCTNVNCGFLHPKPCKFGKFCKNQSECTFSHNCVNRGNLTWRSK